MWRDFSAGGTEVFFVNEKKKREGESQRVVFLPRASLLWLPTRAAPLFVLSGFLFSLDCSLSPFFRYTQPPSPFFFTLLHAHVTGVLQSSNITIIIHCLVWLSCRSAFFPSRLLSQNRFCSEPLFVQKKKTNKKENMKAIATLITAVVAAAQAQDSPALQAALSKYPTDVCWCVFGTPERAARRR